MKTLVNTISVSLVDQSAKMIKITVSTIYGSVGGCGCGGSGLIPHDVVVSAKSRRRIRIGLIKRH